MFSEETNYTYQWKPQKDITTYELAQCVAILIGYKDSPFTIYSLVKSLPVECQRHFEESVNV